MRKTSTIFEDYDFNPDERARRVRRERNTKSNNSLTDNILRGVKMFT